MEVAYKKTVIYDNLHTISIQWTLVIVNPWIVNNLSFIIVNIFGETGRLFYNINYMLNSKHLSLVNKIGDKPEFTITRVHCILNTFDEISAIAIQCRNNKLEVRYGKESSLQTARCTLGALWTKGWKLGHKRIIVLTHIGHNYNSPLMSLLGAWHVKSHTFCKAWIILYRFVYTWISKEP